MADSYVDDPYNILIHNRLMPVTLRQRLRKMSFAGEEIPSKETLNTAGPHQHDHPTPLEYCTLNQAAFDVDGVEVVDLVTDDSDSEFLKAGEDVAESSHCAPEINSGFENQPVELGAEETNQSSVQVGRHEEPVRRVLPPSIGGPLKRKADESGSGKLPKVVKFSVFDVLKALSENTTETQDNLEGLDLLQKAKSLGMTFHRPRWWPGEEEEGGVVLDILKLH